MNLTIKAISSVSSLSGSIFRGSNIFRLISTSTLSVANKEPCFAYEKMFSISNCQRNFSKDATSLKAQVFQSKKRFLIKKKKTQEIDEKECRIVAYSTAEEYDLESLIKTVPELMNFKPTAFNLEYGDVLDIIHAEKDLGEQLESQHLFLFREGCVVMWNMTDDEASQVLNFLKPHEDCRFSNDVIKHESEVMTYSYSTDRKETGIFNGSIKFCTSNDTLLEKYAISNAMALSVHLGTFEANLDQYIESMEPVTEDLKAGRVIKMSREEVLRKMGQLFALRHNINLNSDFLDTPDFYWDREELEKLYHKIFNFFCIQKRTRVMNERINHCIELVELLSSHLNDKHHVRLEWMIIILIMVEVVFEIIHFMERILDSQEDTTHVPASL